MLTQVYSVLANANEWTAVDAVDVRSGDVNEDIHSGAYRCGHFITAASPFATRLSALNNLCGTPSLRKIQLLCLLH